MLVTSPAKPRACAACPSFSECEVPSRSLTLDPAASSAKAATAGRGSGAVRWAGRALEDDEPSPLQLRHELLGEQAGGHLPDGAAPWPATFVDAQAIGQGGGKLRLIDWHQRAGQRGSGLGCGVGRFRRGCFG